MFLLLVAISKLWVNVMIDLRQKELKEWQDRNFGHQPPEMFALGMSEEVGEICHHVLKGLQRIRGGVNGINKKEVADGVADVLVFGIQLLSALDMDAETEISEVINKVLKRDWKKDVAGNNANGEFGDNKFLGVFLENNGTKLVVWVAKAKNKSCQIIRGKGNNQEEAIINLKRNLGLIV